MQIAKSEAFEPNGVLKPGVHDPLYADLPKLAMAAGLGGAQQFVVKSARPWLDKQEVEWAGSLNQRMAEGRAGMLYTGDVPKVPQRFMALTGAFLRNYVNARFLPLQLALDEFRSEGTVTASILLIPDFHVPVGAGVTGIRGLSGTYKDKQRAERSTSKPQFVIDTVSSLLLERLSAGQYTYLFSEDPSRIAQDYGPYVLRLLQENYDMKQSAGSASSD